MKEKNTLSRKTILQYSIGEPGFYFVSYLISYYLMYYMTDIIFIPIALAGVIYSAVQWVEAITSMLCGIAIDRTVLRRGKYRPWLIIGSVICSVFITLVFTKISENVIISTILFTLFYTIAYTGYNLMWVSYRSLLGVIGTNSKETVYLSITASQLGTIAGLAFSYIGVKLISVFEGKSYGYTFSAALYGIIMIGAMLVVYRAAAPYDGVHLTLEPKLKGEKVSLREVLSGLSGPIIPFLFAQVLRNAASMIFGTLVIYYFKLIIGNEGLLSVYIFSYTIIQFLSGFIVRLLVKKYSKLKIYYTFTLTAFIMLIGAFLLGKSTVLFIVFLVIYLFAYSISGLLYMPFVSDIADYNESEKGLSGKAFTYSISSSIIYLAQMVGAGISAWGLTAIGYDPSLAVQPQNVLSGIRIIVILGPAAVIFLSLIPMLFYRLNSEVMEKIYSKKEAANTQDSL